MIDEFMQAHPKGHFMQTEVWAKVKKDWKSRMITVKDENGAIKGAMLLLIRKVPIFPYRIMYAPRGPVCDINDFDTLNELTKQARLIAKENKVYVLKIDPDVESDQTEFLDIMKKLGYKIKNSKNFEGIQPNYVFRLDIEGKTEEEIMAEFHHKTRYNIRVAQKKGVEVSLGSREDLPRFHEIMEETGLRDEFVIRSLDYFERMYDVLGDKLRLYIAKHEGKMVAGTIAIHYGDKVWYLYGASSNHARNIMPNYLLQWEMIRWAVELGCKTYDFRGVSGDLDESNPLYGLYRFKKGFNGKFTEFVGELELVFKPAVARMIETGTKVFFGLRKRAFLLKGAKK